MTRFAGQTGELHLGFRCIFAAAMGSMLFGCTERAANGHGADGGSDVASATGQVGIDAVPFRTIAAPLVASADHAGMAAIDSDGVMVLIGDDGTSLLRIDLDDGSESTSGRAGDGPGEFRGLGKVAGCHGTGFVALDTKASRLTYYDSELHLVRTVVLTEPALDLTCNRGGFVWAAIMPANLPRLGAEDSRMSSKLVMFDSAGLAVDSVIGVDFGDYRALGARLRLSSSSDMIIFGSGRTDSVRMIHRGDGIERTGKVGILGRPVSDTAYASAVEEILQGLRNPDEREPFRKIYLRMSHPSTLPAYSGLFAAGDARLLAVTSPPNTEPVRIEAHSLPDLAELDGTITFKRRLGVVAASSRYLALWRSDDSGGTDSIEIYRWWVGAPPIALAGLPVQ